MPLNQRWFQSSTIRIYIDVSSEWLLSIRYSEQFESIVNHDQNRTYNHLAVQNGRPRFDQLESRQTQTPRLASTVSQAYFALDETLHKLKKMLEKNIFFRTKVTSEAFLSTFQNLKATRLQGCTQTKLWTCWRNFDLSRSFELWGSFMALLCSSRWSNQKCCKTECVALKTSFLKRPMRALQTHFLARYRFLKWGSKFRNFFYETSKIFNDFSRENHGHGGHEHGVYRGVSGVSFHIRWCPQGVASVLCKKTPIFGSRRSKLDHLTVRCAPFAISVVNKLAAGDDV